MTNNVFCGEASRFRGNFLAAMDRLPTAVRRALHEMTIEHDPREVRWRLNRLIKGGVDARFAEQMVIADYLRDEAVELKQFALTWPSRFGRYPAVAAQASILRYDSGRSATA